MEDLKRKAMALVDEGRSGIFTACVKGHREFSHAEFTHMGMSVKCYRDTPENDIGVFQVKIHIYPATTLEIMKCSNTSSGT